MMVECIQAMSAVDSTTVFAARLNEKGLGEYKQKFTELKWDTFAKFAFASSSFKVLTTSSK